MSVSSSAFDRFAVSEVFPGTPGRSFIDQALERSVSAKRISAPGRSKTWLQIPVRESLLHQSTTRNGSPALYIECKKCILKVAFG